MCEVGKKLKLCSCFSKGKTLEQNRNSRRHKNQISPDGNKNFTWILSKYLGKEEEHDLSIEGMLDMPSSILGGTLTDAFVLDEINERNCFDFDYSPTEKDRLLIEYERNKYWTEFFSFIFINGKWMSKIYWWEDKSEDINFGRVEIK